VPPSNDLAPARAAKGEIRAIGAKLPARPSSRIPTSPDKSRAIGARPFAGRAGFELKNRLSAPSASIQNDAKRNLFIRFRLQQLCGNR
jgi:hypothetical protein